MKKAILLASAVVATAVAGAVVLGGSAASAATAKTCTVNGINGHVAFGTTIYIGQNDKAFKVSGNTVTGTYKVTGDAGCTAPVTLAIWKSPSKNGQPINSQTLYSYKTVTVGPGTHTISSTIPDCYFQADLLQSTNPKAPDGTANYGWQNGDWVKDGSFRGYAMGGGKTCVDEATTPTTPTTPSNPTTPAKTLPVTGPASMLVPVASLSAVAAAAHNLYRRRLARR